MTVSGVPERVWDNRSKQADDEQTSPLENSSTPRAELAGWLIPSYILSYPITSYFGTLFWWI